MENKIVISKCVLCSVYYVYNIFIMGNENMSPSSPPSHNLMRLNATLCKKWKLDKVLETSSSKCLSVFVFNQD